MSDVDPGHVELANIKRLRWSQITIKFKEEVFFLLHQNSRGMYVVECGTAILVILPSIDSKRYGILHLSKNHRADTLRPASNGNGILGNGHPSHQ